MLITSYIEEIQRILSKVSETQTHTIQKASDIICGAIRSKKKIYIFGCNHASILAQELFYRTGGLVSVNPILAPGLHLDAVPITLTTDMERLCDYGNRIIDNYRLIRGDVLIIHSVSGRNSVPIDAALQARKLGVYVIGLTNLATSSSVPSRHLSGKRLFEVCDLVIDNCGCYGDAALEIGGFPQKFAPSSTAIGAVILNAMIAEVIGLLMQNGTTPPVFISSNIDGGDGHNEKIMNEYRSSITYI